MKYLLAAAMAAVMAACFWAAWTAAMAPVVYQDAMGETCGCIRPAMDDEAPTIDACKGIDLDKDKFVLVQVGRCK